MAIDMERLARVYNKIRAARSEATRIYEENDKKLKEQLSILECQMLVGLAESNGQAIRTKAGTIYMELKTIPTGSDWDLFYKWVAKHDAFDALEKRIKTTFITKFMEANGGKLPPGVSVFREYVARVRNS
jgi:hypothetical protein